MVSLWCGCWACMWPHICPFLQQTSQHPWVQACPASHLPCSTPYKHLLSSAAGIARRNTFYQTIYNALTASVNSASGAASALRGEPLLSWALPSTAGCLLWVCWDSSLNPCSPAEPERLQRNADASGPLQSPDTAEGALWGPSKHS